MKTAADNPVLNPGPVKQKKRGRIRISQILLHLALIIGSIVMAGPFIWMALSSLKSFEQIFAVPPVWIPDPFVWSNFTDSLQAMPFGRAYFNSFYISTIVVVSQVLTCSMAAYAFAKLKFPGSKVLFIAFLATMMVPMQVTLIPLYIIMDNIGWVNTHLSIIVPNALFNAFGVFLLRQFMMGIPKEMEEAAVMDGANPLYIYAKIMLPLIKPALAAFAIFSFIGIWNNFIQPLVFLSDTTLFTVPLLLATFKGLYVTNWPLMMAGATISVVPVLIVYFFAQRQIIEGIALTGVKG
ncbi:carbohydrate ABC transporter permease [Shouchella clausii]|jgi:multiple sugar transport system permease protein|uniref:carbohydrate ABC transporter permease n=1 Tax=Shouchella clausii TaxID=79880 RepID=UPI000B9A07B9|nr:carbohydrate ABC transporter permease [Shouchella clausii]SPU21322.1 sugar ABC transporter permease [Niallia circulans]AST94987.1 sugar ABC transporter permease [Shouchella clausii]MBU8596189.1 carbohydrate ABC transporter permease [Shouchella clausii]MCM3549229.1 carbohydrate ABC transporter permease [Shouchella clausii]MCR1288142.1 carbohydrate ABC transporter permease [Shouchella clausii]